MIASSCCRRRSTAGLRELSSVCRKSRCRPAPSSRLLRWPPRSRGSCPSRGAAATSAAMPVGDQPVAQLAQPSEPGPRLLLVLVPRRQQHQPGQPHRPRSERRHATMRAASSLGGAELRRLAGEIHLHEHLGRAPRVRLPPRRAVCSSSTESTDWMQANGPAAFLRLVRLQVADQVPPSPECRPCPPIFCRASWTLFSPNSRWPAARRPGRARRRTSSRRR